MRAQRRFTSALPALTAALMSLMCVQAATAQSTGSAVSYREVRRTASFASGIGATGILPVDIDHDGVQELVMSGESMFPRTSFWSIAAYDAQSGGYEISWQSPRYATADTGANITALQVVEAGGTLRNWVALWDGRIDVVDLLTRQSVQTLSPTNVQINDLTVADVDNDGTLDVAAVTFHNTYLYDPVTLSLKRTLPYGGSKIEVGNVDADAVLETVFDTGLVLEITANAATPQWQAATYFGERMQLADIDGDGRAEVIASQRHSNVIRAWDVDTQSQQWSVTGQYQITALRLLDVTGDGTPEILYADRPLLGVIHVLDAATRTEILQIPDPEDDATDFAVVSVDGASQLIWGSGFQSTGPDFLNVYDLSSRALKWKSHGFFGPYEGVDVGDLEGDGSLEIVLSSHRAPGDNGWDDGRIVVLDADTHAVEWSVRIPDISIPPSTSLHRVKLANLDTDPQLEILVATDDSNSGALYVIDGLTRAQDPVVVPEGGVILAWSQITIGDLDGDGQSEVITGTWALNNTFIGVFLYVLDPTDYSVVWKSGTLPNEYPDPMIYDGVGRAHTTDVIAADVGAPGMDIVSVSARVHAIRWSDRQQLDSIGDNYLSVVAADVSSAPGAEILAGTKAGRIDVLNGDTLAVIASHAVCNGPINALQMQSATQVVAACSDRLVVYDTSSQTVVDVTLSTVGKLGLNASMVRVVHRGRSMVVAGGDDVVTFVDAAGNHAPVVNGATATMHWRGSSADLQLTATDADGDPLHFELTSRPTSGVATWLDANDGRLRFATKPGARVGVDAFQVRVFDGLQYSATQQIAVTLTNTAPTATNAQYNVTAGAAVSGSLSGADADGDPVRYSIVQQPAVGTLTVDAATGAFQYASSATGSGTVTATFVVDDGASTSQGSLQFQYQAATPNPTPTPPSSGGKKGGGGSTDLVLLGLLAGLLALSRRPYLRSAANRRDTVAQRSNA